MDKFKMDLELHGQGRTITDSIEGHSIGDMIDRAIRKRGIQIESVGGVKVEIDGVIIWLRKPKEDPGG